MGGEASRAAATADSANAGEVSGGRCAGALDASRGAPAGLHAAAPSTRPWLVANRAASAATADSADAGGASGGRCAGALAAEEGGAASCGLRVWG